MPSEQDFAGLVNQTRASRPPVARPNMPNTASPAHLSVQALQNFRPSLPVFQPLHPGIGMLPMQQAPFVFGGMIEPTQLLPGTIPPIGTQPGLDHPLLYMPPVSDPLGGSGGGIWIDDGTGRGRYISPEELDKMIKTGGPGGGDWTTRCGPDVTDWFLKEIEIHTTFWEGANAGYSHWPMFYAFATYAATIPYKWLSFQDLDDKCPTECPNTVTLCDVCINISELGNLIFGITGSMQYGQSASVFGGQIANYFFGTGAIDSARDVAGVMAGFVANGNRNGGPVTRNTLCDSLSADITQLAASTGASGGLSEKQAAIVNGSVNARSVFLNTMKYPCPVCPKPLPADFPHSSFDWVDVDHFAGTSKADWIKNSYSGFVLDHRIGSEDLKAQAKRGG